ncbi:MAG: alpha/beta hydrolase [Proteobacteria bacterium]|nr:MAG: alpha/beta hydrolase [Pseudomonadota bacterium]
MNRVRELIFMTFMFGLTACNHLYYFPDQEEYRKPSQFPFAVKEVSIDRAGQTPIHAWLMNDSESSKGLILHFHGNAQNLTAHSAFSDWLAAEGYTVLIFDYSGYGKTLGEPTQQTLIADSQAAFAFVEGQARFARKGLPWVVFAQSLGGAVAVTSLAENPEFAKKVDLLIVESSFDSYQGLARAKLSHQALTWVFSPIAYWLVSDYRVPSEAIKSLTMPKIIVHGSADEVVYFENGKALYDAALPPKEFWEIPYGNHTEAFISGSPYRQDLLTKLKEISRKSPSPR